MDKNLMNIICRGTSYLLIHLKYVNVLSLDLFCTSDLSLMSLGIHLQNNIPLL